MFRNIVYRILLLAFIAGISRHTLATHSMGLDISYECLGGDSFLVTLSFYRDCEGVAAPPSANIDFNSASCAQSFIATLPLLSVSELNAVCASFQTTCSGGTYPGAEEYIYQGVVVLPAQCPDWKISYSLCCRNNAITNINPTNVNIYVENTLDNTITPCNSSPVFTINPVPFMCVGVPYCFNNGAFDPDGDSLVYQLVTPTTGPNPGDTANYIPPFTSTDPMTSAPPMTFDPVTGDICLTPQILGEVSVMQVRIQEWRGGVLIGTVERDIQLRAINCPVPNNLPVVDGINGSGQFSARVCANDTVSFFTNSIDTDITQTVTMTWNGGIPGAVFTIDTLTAPGRPIGNFYWIPGNGDISNVPYCFIVQVVDDNCPFLGMQAFSFCITVTGIAPVIDSIKHVDCAADCDGTGAVHFINGIEPYTYAWNDPLSQTGSMATGLCAGSYSVTGMDSTGCTSTANVVINGPAPLAAPVSTVDVSCRNGSDGMAAVSASGGTPPYTFLWSSVPAQTDSTATGLMAGNYSVTVTDANGCDTISGITITEPMAVLSASIDSGSNVSCSGNADGQATVFPAGGTTAYTYQWNTVPVQTTANATGLAAGVYTVTVTDANGCDTTAVITITEPSLIYPGITDSRDVSCFGGTDGQATVSVSGGTPSYAYQWNTMPGQTDSMATGLSAGNYTVTVTDSNGCDTSISITINEPPLLVAGISSNSGVTCNGGADGMAAGYGSGGSPPYSYLWNTVPAQADSHAVGLPAGSYILTVTDTAGCSDTAQVQITEPSQLTAAIGSLSHVMCNGNADGEATVIPSGGNTPYSFSWSSGGTAATETGLSAGQYSVTVVDSMGWCTVVDSVMINEPAAIEPGNILSTDVSCWGDNDGTAVVSSSGGTGAHTYTWSTVPVQTASTATGLYAGIYSVTITDANGCDTTAAVVINEPDMLVAGISSATNVSCHGGNDGQATANSVGGIPPYTYSWNTTPAQFDSTANNLSAGPYRVIVTDSNGCPDTAQVNITEPALLSLNFSGINVSCNGGNSGQAIVTTSGGTSPYTYLWDAAAGSQTDSIATGLTAGAYNVTVTDANGCDTSGSLTLTEPGPVGVMANADDTICTGTAFNISAVANGGNGGYLYSWDQGLGAGQIHQVNPSTTTTYRVTATDSLGCTGPPDSVTIYVMNLFQDTVDAISTGNVCEGASTSVYAMHSGSFGPYAYSWNQSLGAGLGPYTVSPMSTTTYVITVTDQCNNSITDSVDVEVYPYPVIDLPVVLDDGCAPLEVTFSDTTGNPVDVTYYWDFGNGYSSNDPSPVYIYEYPGTYIVSLTIISAVGCTAQADTATTVQVHPAPVAAFSASPSVTDMQSPEISFTDGSNDAITWNWDFGDGETSTQTNPSHIYQDTGTYQVRLSVKNQYGCMDHFVLDVRVDPYYEVNVPTAFIPNPGGPNGGLYDKDAFDNSVFIPFSEYVEDFHLMIFNRWGELIFETFDINIGWDGYYRGVLSQLGVYVWKADITYTDGKKVTKVGDITLIR